MVGSYTFNNGSDRHLQLVMQGVFVPDEIVQSYIDAVVPLTPSLYEKRLELAPTNPEFDISLETGRITIPTPTISREETCSLVQKSFSGISREFGLIADGCINLPNRLIVSEDTPGQGRGTAFGITPEKPYPYIHFVSDKTINDPLYLSHEMGHYAANIIYEGRYSDAMQIRPRRNLAEPQAFFFQNLMYDTLSERSEYAYAASIHFVAEMTNLLYTVPNALLAQKEQKNRMSISGRREYAEALFGKAYVDLHEPTRPENLEWLKEKAFLKLHSHGLGALIGTGLYLAAKEKGTLSQTVELLFEPARFDNIRDVLRKAGIGNKISLRHFAEKSVAYLANAPERHATRFEPYRQVHIANPRSQLKLGA